MNRYVDDQNTALDIVRAANDSNTAIHVIDPRGLRVAGGVAAMLETLASGSGGERAYEPTTSSGAVQRIVGQAAATVSPGLHQGGGARRPLSPKSRSRSKRGGYDVRARNGYWAPALADVERARTAAAAAVLPPPIARRVRLAQPRRSPRGWSRYGPAPGRCRTTAPWSASRARRLPPRPRGWRRGAGDRKRPVDRRSRAAGREGHRPRRDQLRDHRDPPPSSRFASSTRPAKSSIANHAPLKRQRVPQALGLAATVHRARNVAETRALSAGDPPHPRRPRVQSQRPHAHTNPRLRHAGPGQPRSPRRLIDRKGATLIALPITGPSRGLAPPRSAPRIDRARRLRGRHRGAERRRPRRSGGAAAGVGR